MSKYDEILNIASNDHDKRKSITDCSLSDGPTEEKNNYHQDVIAFQDSDKLPYPKEWYRQKKHILFLDFDSAVDHVLKTNGEILGFTDLKRKKWRKKAIGHIVSPRGKKYQYYDQLNGVLIGYIPIEQEKYVGIIRSPISIITIISFVIAAIYMVIELKILKTTVRSKDILHIRKRQKIHLRFRFVPLAAIIRTIQRFYSLGMLPSKQKHLKKMIMY